MKLNLGCGTDIRKGYVNVDVVPLKGVDRVVDLNAAPWPFKTGSVDEIFTHHVIDHLDDPTAFLRECHRILKKGGKAIIIVPHFTSASAYWGGVRKHQFSWMTFQRYKGGNRRDYYFDFHFSEATVDFQFQTKPRIVFWYGPLLRKIANRWPYVYEMTALRVFPCIQIRIELVK
jgi:SAM-dependent methyltransferase